MKAYFLIILSCFQAAAATASTIKGAYYPSWAQDTLLPSSIATNLFTHIYYAFLTPNDVTFDFNVPQTQALFLVNFTSTLRAASPPVTTLFSINGERPLFARIASDSSSRATFIRYGIQVARDLGFDGIDLDWEYPQDQAEMDNLGLLFEEWRAEVEREAAATARPPLLLTAAVWYTVDIGPRAYPTGSMARNLDLINVMNYDYTGSWNRVTGAHAALFDPRGEDSTSHGFETWIQAGVPRNMLVMGLPLYGRTWQLEDPSTSSGIGAPAVGAGPGNDGAMTYAEVVEFNEENNAEVVYDNATVSVYSVSGSSWIGYDDTRSVAVKIDYAQRLGLAGYFFWQIIGDNNWEITGRASQLWSQ